MELIAMIFSPLIFIGMLFVVGGIAVGIFYLNCAVIVLIIIFFEWLSEKCPKLY